MSRLATSFLVMSFIAAWIAPSPLAATEGRLRGFGNCEAVRDGIRTDFRCDSISGAECVLGKFLWDLSYNDGVKWCGKVLETAGGAFAFARRGVIATVLSAPTRAEVDAALAADQMEQPASWMVSGWIRYGHAYMPHVSWFQPDGWRYLARQTYDVMKTLKTDALPLAAGETAELAIKVRGDTHPRVRGFGGPVYLHFRPHPKASFDLAGEWKAYRTAYAAAPTPVAVPMAKRMKDTFMLGRKFTLPEAFRTGGCIAIDFQSASDALGGVIVNGRYLRRHHHVFGDRTTLDITPFVNRTGENEIFLVHLTGSRDC